MRRILLILATLIGAAAVAQANPILDFPSQYGYGPVLSDDLSTIIPIVLIALAIEYVIFRCFTAGVVPKFWASIGIFLGIHLISWPLTQLVYLFTHYLAKVYFYHYLDTAPTALVGPGILAELVPITIEALWYFWIIRRLSPGRFTMKRAWITSLVANAASYIAGLVMFLALIPSE